MGDSYAFSSLNKQSHQIRLLKLEPGVGEDRIVCGLQVNLLEENPAYEALSYTWGDALDRQEIILDGCPFSVTSSLGTALQYLRRESESRILWIDAICINQSDDGEKLHQVNMMRQIYEKAAGVLVWLGGPSEDSDNAMDLIQEFSMLHEMTHKWVDQDGWYEYDSDEPFRDLYELQKRFVDRYPQPRAVRGFFELFKRPYWTRMWVLQETAVATGDLSVGCGSRWAAWLVFGVATKFMYTMLRSSDYDDEVQSILSQRENSQYRYCVFAELEQIRHQISGSLKGFEGGLVRYNIFRLLELCWLRHATNPRDYVYALLGLFAWDFNTNREPIHSGLSVPDYTKSVSQVYGEMVKATIELEETLFILDLKNHNNISCFPTWIPDFSAPRSSRYPNYGKDDSGSHPVWFPAGLIRSSGTKPFKVSGDLTTLETQGAVVDCIEKIVNLEDIRSTPVEALRRIHNAVHGTTNPLKGKYRRNTVEIWMSILEVLLHEHDTTLPIRTSPMNLRRQAELLEYDIRGDEFHYILPVVQGAISYTSETPHRKFIIGKTGLLGLGPPESTPGDSICILVGYFMPVVLRLAGDCFAFVGSAYVHDIMWSTEHQDVLPRKKFREIKLI